jgi:hypothetical protein
VDPSDAPLEVARQFVMLSHPALWVRYVGLGGTLGLAEMTEHVHGQRDCARVEHDTIVHALNEAYMDHGMNHPIPYAEDEEAAS